MKEQHIKALKVSPLERPEICYLKNKLRALQEAVSIGADYVGLIEWTLTSAPASSATKRAS